MIQQPEPLPKVLLAEAPGGVASLLGRQATVPAVVVTTALATGFAAAISASIAFIAGHPAFPGIAHAVVTTALLVPPATLLFLEVVRQLGRTERQLESALLVRESRFETLARISPVGIFQTDAAGLCLFVNDRWREIAGLRAAEAAGEGWARSLHPEDRARVFQEWNACVREERPFRSEYRFQRPDGAITWVLGQAEAKRSGNSQVVGYFGTLTDITRSKENEAALQRTNRALKVVSECNEALVRITDEAELLREICRIIVETGQHRMAWVGFAENDEAKTVRPAAKWGFDEGYLDQVRVTWADRWHGPGPAAQAIRGRKPYVVKDTATDPSFVTWRKQALARGFASAVALPLQNDSNVIGILGIYAPIVNAFDDEEVRLLAGLADNLSYGIAALRARAENTRAAEAIRESEDRFRATFEHSAVGISHVSPDWQYLRVNQKFCDITGYSRSELLNLSFSDITHPADRSRDQEHARRVLAGEIPTSSLEKRYVRKDGSVVWVNRTISLVRDPAGVPKYYICVVQDITAAKKMEMQLRQAQKMEAVGQLTGGIAHDFNNLLTVVLGNLELLRDNAKADPAIRDLAARAIAAADRGAALTQRLLAFSRKQVLQPQMTDVNKLVENMNDLLRRSLGETIQVETKLATDLPATMVDPVQLETALLNLAVNARDAMPRGGLLRIETGHGYLDQVHGAEGDDVAPGEYLHLSVIDTGTGMNPEVRERVFEPFFTTKVVGKGSGLGLSMVYGFVKQSGGHVAISSEPGKGTTVRIYLPCVAEKPRGMAEARPLHPHIEPHGESILLVEDDEEVRTLATRLLRELGYSVIETADSQTAIAVLEQGAPVDLLLVDMSLPGEMNGLDVARETLKRRSGAKVLFASGFSDAIPGFLPAPATGGPPVKIQVLSKPFHRSELAAQVREALDG